LGQNRPCRPRNTTSALPRSTDIARPDRLVRFVPLPDSCTAANLIVCPPSRIRAVTVGGVSLRGLLYRRRPKKNSWAPEASGTALFGLPRSFLVSVISQLAGFLQSFDALDTSGQLSRSFESGLSHFPIFISRICVLRRHVSIIPWASPIILGLGCLFQLNRNFRFLEPFK
jgi:hypothetical protein